MPWTPAALIGSGKTGGYFDLSNLSTLFQDSSAATAVTADSQPLGTLRGTVSGGTLMHDATQGTSTAKPTYRTDGTKHWMEFDGGDWMDFGIERFGNAGLFAGPSESWTVAVACDTGNGTWVARCGSGGVNTRQFQLISYPGTNTPALACRGSNFASNPTPIDGGGNNGLAPQVIILRWDGTTLTTRSRDYTTTLTPGTTAEETGQRICLGARTNGVAAYMPAGSKIHQLFLVDVAISDTEMGYLAYHFGQKVGIAIGTQPPADSGVTGSLAAQENSDGVAATGSVCTSGTVVANEQSDAVLVSGIVSSAGVLLGNEVSDIAAITGGVNSSGALSSIEAPDIMTSAGAVANGLAGSLVGNEVSDIVAITGTVSSVGMIAATESSDVVSVTGAVMFPITGGLTAVEATDTATATGAVSSVGSLTATEAPDAVSATGAVLSPVTGLLGATESPDTVLATGSVGAEPEHAHLPMGYTAFKPRVEHGSRMESQDLLRVDTAESIRIAS